LGGDVARVVPYFFNWVHSEFREFPDGRGRYFQPKKLLAAFDIMSAVRAQEREPAEPAKG
jgi:hypothetical protein